MALAFGVIGQINKGISTTIGLAAEKYYDHKDRKEALKTDPDEPIVDDEEDWALDEAAGDPQEQETEHQAEARPAADRTISDLVHDAMPARGETFQAKPEESTKLPYPVIIPQRRPGTKGRGFARAYPPDLEAFGIDQETFIHFLNNFQESSKASPWLNALYISAGAVGFVPGVITLAVSISVQVAAGTAIELQSRYRANAFLDQMNKELFMPLGLYAMVLMYKPEGPGTAEAPAFGVETVNLNNAKHISKWGLPKQNPDDEVDAVSKSKGVLRPIRLASGKTDETMMPFDVAPLVYPGLEDMMERPDVVRDESFKQRVQRNKEFVAQYFDKRASAKYQGKHPDTTLAKATASNTPQFRSRFADPNHPVNNGHLFSLVTGGKYTPRPRRRPWRREVGPDGKLGPEPKDADTIRGPFSLVRVGVKKVLSPNILYMTVVNMPSEEELAEAKALLEQDKTNFGDMLKALREKKEM